jgi:hypothetical protein
MVGEEMSFRQRAMVQFPFKGEIPASDTHSRLQSAYGDACICVSRVRMWVAQENTDIAYRHRSGRPATASTDRNKGKVD